MAKDGYGAGHGGNDPGAVSQGNIERDLAIVMNNAMISAGSRAGWTIKNLSVNKGYPYNINEPVYLANINGVRYAVQNHFNAGGGSGCEVLYHPAGGESARRLAAAMSSAIAKTYGIPDRGAKARTNLGFLNSTNMTAFIIEWGFVDAPGNSDVPKIMANPVSSANAVIKALGGKVQEVEINPGKAKNNNGLRYRGHSQNKDWLAWVNDGRLAGTKAGGLNLEAIQIDLSKLNIKGEIELQVTVNIKDEGQKTYVVNKNGTYLDGKKVSYIGTTGKKRRLELITIVVTKNTTGKTLYMQGHRADYGNTNVVKLANNQPRSIGSVDFSNGLQAFGLWAA